MNDRKGRNKGCCFADKLKNCFGGKGRCNSVASKLSKHVRNGKVKVCRVTGDRKVCARMASMGLYPGVEADIICANSSAQCVLKVNGGTISLDSDASDNVYVTSL